MQLGGVTAALFITGADRATIGADQTRRATAPPRSAAASPLEAMDGNRDVDARNDADAAQQPSRSAQTATARQSLRQAAAAVLLAGDAGDGRLELPVAMDRLRAALAKPATVRAAGAHRPLRQGTKQATVLALLRRAEGASGPQLIEATGWAPHTVRGFLAGLARKGITLTVLERVPQIGPDKQGARGSFTVYRIAEAG